MTKNKKPGIGKNFMFTGLTRFFTDTSVKMAYSVMPLFMMSTGASKTAISLIEGGADCTASLLRAATGYWSDRTGKKVFMIVGYGMTALMTLLYALAVAPGPLLFRFCDGTLCSEADDHFYRRGKAEKDRRHCPSGAITICHIAKTETVMDNRGMMVHDDDCAQESPDGNY